MKDNQFYALVFLLLVNIMVSSIGINEALQDAGALQIFVQFGVIVIGMIFAAVSYFSSK